jgi:hypothetical protein
MAQFATVPQLGGLADNAIEKISAMKHALV